MYKSISIILGQLVLYWHSKDRYKYETMLNFVKLIVKE
jgi:hypothetical protein